MFNRISRLGLATIILASACGEVPVTTTNTDLSAMSNPLATASPLVFQAPVFDKLKDTDYRPAIEAGMKRQLAEVEAITSNTEPATFENTIVAMEKSGVDLTRANKIFFGLTGSATNDSLQAIKAELAPKLSAHGDAITLNNALFQRVKAVYDGRVNAGLDPVSTRLIERYYARFVRAGALLDAAAKEQMKKLNEEEANLSTKFQDNILKARSAAAVIVDKKEQLDGMSEEVIAAAADAAKAKGQEGKWLIEIVNTTTQPVLVSLKDRSLREMLAL
jgi:peptidyl-dipeptidase Dcp